MESLLFECLEFKSKRSSHFEWETIIRFMKIPKLLQRHLFSEESSIVTSLLAICDLYYQWSQSYQLGNHRPLVIAHQLVAGIAIEWFAKFGLQSNWLNWPPVQTQSSKSNCIWPIGRTSRSSSFSAHWVTTWLVWLAPWLTLIDLNELLNRFLLILRSRSTMQLCHQVDSYQLL